MRKTILFLLLIIFSLLLTSCIDYSDYKDVKIPDDNIGTVKIPNHWEFEVIDDWIHVVDTAKDETIGIQWYKGVYYTIGSHVYDERIYNPYFDNYTRLSSSFVSGNSNGSQWGQVSFEKEDILYEYRLIYFIGSLDSSYLTEIIIIDELVDDVVLSNIAKSYKR